MAQNSKDNNSHNTDNANIPANINLRGPGGLGGGGFRGGQRGGHWGMMPVVKPKNFKATMLRLWKYFGKERRLLSIITIFVLADVGIGLSTPYLIGKSVDALSGGTGMVDFGLLGISVTALLLAYLTSAAVNFIQGWLMAGVSQRIVLGLRRTLFARLQELPISYFDTHIHGDLMSRLTNDIDNVSSTISQSTTQLMSNALMITGSLIMMLLLSPPLTLASMVTVPLVFMLTKGIAKNTKVLFKQQQAILGKLNGHIEETISGIHTVKAFGHEHKAIEQFEDINTDLCKVGIKAQILSGFMMPLMNVISNIGFAAVAGVGGYLAVRDMISIGVIASFLSYSRQFSRPLNDTANIFNTLQTAVAGAERVFEVLDEPGEPSDSPDAVVLDNPKGYVIFENVTFGYRPEVPVLRNVSFIADEGSITALVGPTGAGKTTIVNLLSRFYDVSEGRIMIDGRDIRDYTRDSLRKCFGIVLQDTYLFSGTIKENIKYGKPEASDEEVKKAAVMANADPFIRRLPKGYDTILSESGGNLSQGQRQLLAIARAILSDPSILILDEATSSVDTRTELHIQEALLKLMKGRTSFIIAHRLSTIRDADVILVIQDGEIVEKGNHECLIENEGGIYSNLYFSQLRHLQDE